MTASVSFVIASKVARLHRRGSSLPLETHDPVHKRHLVVDKLLATAAAAGVVVVVAREQDLGVETQ